MLRCGQVEVHQVPTWTDNLVWLMVVRSTGEAAAVDGPEAGPVLDYCRTHGFRLTTIFNTHTHADHIGINRDLEKRGLLSSMRVVGCAARRADIPGLNEPVSDGDEISFGNLSGQVLLTEGHIDGHISFLFEDALFLRGYALHRRVRIPV